MYCRAFGTGSGGMLGLMGEEESLVTLGRLDSGGDSRSVKLAALGGMDSGGEQGNSV